MPSRSSFFMLLTLSLTLCVGVLSPIRSLAADDPPAIQIPQTIDGGVPLLEKIGTLSNIPVTQGFGTLLTYINDIANWLLLVAGGICVLWVLVGGMQMMLSGLDNSLQSKGKESMKWAIIGLVILLFSGFILRTLNSMFFK